MDTSDPAAFAALQLELHRLETVRSQVHECVSRLPAASDGAWRGIAQRAFAGALHGVATELAAASGQLDTALSLGRGILHGMLPHA